ncbi:MAG: hypothetical protein V1744_00105 [Candidatus Altiarchaeota archaeon]
MDDKIFAVSLERSRIYWDYYRSMFVVFSLCFIAGMVSTAIIYTQKEISLVIAAGIIGLMFLMVILLSALMSITIWRHENKHLDELIRAEEQEILERPPGIPLA